MNDYKTLEFRTAKYLRSNPNHVEYFNRHRESLTVIGKKYWNNIEYLDEIVENPGQTIYYVKPGKVRGITRQLGLISERDRHLCEFEPATMQILRNVVVCKGVSMPDAHDYEPVTVQDIQSIEETNGAGYYLINTSAIPNNEPYIWTLYDMPVIQHPWVTYAELFFEKEEAKDYAIAITEYLQYNSDAISAMSQFF